MRSSAYLLPVSSILLAGVVDGLNTCLDSTSPDFKCTAGTEVLGLDVCFLVQDDVSDISACFDSVGRTSLKVLYFGSFPEWAQITTLPEGFLSGLINLEILSLSFTELTALPAGLLSELTSLQSFSIEDVGINELPEDLFTGVFTLERVRLSYNSLAMLPGGFFQDLVLLRELYINENGLLTLDEDIFSTLENLEFLSMGNNDLTNLPASIFSNLGMLTELRMGSNQFTTLPADLFAGLANLEELSLVGNDELECVPATTATRVDLPTEFVGGTCGPIDFTTPSPVITPTDGMCSNGVAGVEGFGQCCPLACGTCGGSNCKSRAEAAGLTEYDCCARRIRSRGASCDESGTAPCTIESDLTGSCSNGVAGVEGFGQCCALECGTCGGNNCRRRARAVGLDAGDCCVQQISAANLMCDDLETAPCTI